MNLTGFKLSRLISVNLSIQNHHESTEQFT